ncbi:MAG: T9SS type A sorting domain-containing protein, partial [Flavobacteriales bacterium]
PSFDVTSGGLYTIHTFVFPSGLDLSVVEPGVTTGVDVLNLLAANNICASLDVAGVAFNVTNPLAGTLVAVDDSVCFLTGTVEIAATPNGGLNVPTGYSVIYVLTEGEGLVIQNVSSTPSFLVGAAGDYTIHTLVYDPNTLDLSIVEPGVTTGFQVNSLLVQGGGSICASLDVAGAQVNATECTGCIADAGTMSGGGDVCGAGSAELVAQANGDAIIPIGSTQAFVLTSGAGLVIEQLGTTPEFTVNEGGLYTIHSFVFPSGLDLSVVEPGVTTGVDVLNLIQASGICASLDVAGTVFNVTTPDAGTLTADGTPCLEGAGVVLSATPNGDSNAPAGYTLAYVLTSGTDLVIEQLGATPEFTVTSGGLYTIHTFVFPSSLDLSVVEPGVTTGVDVLNLLAANNICASLDVAGAAFNVEACSDECLANAGDIIPASFIVCRQGGTATLTGIPLGNAVVPAGYQTLYVLTRGPGLVIRQVSPTPQFTVSQLGIYTIHTLVYDPATLDLSIVVPGQTTGFDVNALLIQDGGSICASLDVQGAPQIVLGPFLCSIINLFNNGIAPQNMDELNSVLAASGMYGASQDMVMNTIEEDLPVNVMNMYPNPTRDMLTIDMAVLVDTDLELSVLNTLGQEVLPGTSLNVGRGANRSVIDVSTLPSGSYLVRLTMSDRVLTQRFTKVD